MASRRGTSASSSAQACGRVLQLRHGQVHAGLCAEVLPALTAVGHHGRAGRPGAQGAELVEVVQLGIGMGVEVDARAGAAGVRAAPRGRSR